VKWTKGPDTKGEEEEQERKSLNVYMKLYTFLLPLLLFSVTAEARCDSIS
jgi:hypothetical protein